MASENPLVKARDIMLEYDMSQEQFDSIKEAFDRYDSDHNGIIDAGEITAVMERCGLKPSEEDVATFMQSVDIDKNGSIEFWEFVKMMGRKNAKRHNTLLVNEQSSKRRR